MHAAKSEFCQSLATSCSSGEILIALADAEKLLATHMKRKSELTRYARGSCVSAYGASLEPALPACIRCKYAYYSQHSTLLQCKKREQTPKYFRDGVCSVYEFERCSYYKARPSTLSNLQKTENAQLQINFE